MRKKWKDHTVHEKSLIYEAIAKVYESAGHPATMQLPITEDVYYTSLDGTIHEDKGKLLIKSEAFSPDN